jgi:hypothetical protein
MNCKLMEAADAMHRELLRQIEPLLTSTVTPHADTLRRLAALVDAYEEVRHPIDCDHAPMQAALDSSVHCIRCGLHLGEAN